MARRCPEGHGYGGRRSRAGLRGGLPVKPLPPSAARGTEGLCSQPSNSAPFTALLGETWAMPGEVRTLCHQRWTMLRASGLALLALVNLVSLSWASGFTGEVFGRPWRRRALLRRGECSSWPCRGRPRRGVRWHGGQLLWHAHRGLHTPGQTGSQGSEGAPRSALLGVM